MGKKEKPFNNPFDRIKLKDEKAPVSTPSRSKPREDRPAPGASDADAELFLRAVGEVSPVRSNKGWAPPKQPPSAASLRIVSAEIEAMTQLCELVAGEGPMDLADSDEFVQGAAPGLDPGILKRLRAGDYSTQDHLDLHGMTRTEAKAALETFIQASRIKGLRCVLVVTGRGLHSKDQIPVLKEGVQGWLTRGRISRQVLAFTSARPQDGGAGAIYVLLRR